MGEINLELILEVFALATLIFLLYLAFKPINESDLKDLARKLRKQKIKYYFPQASQTNGKSSHYKKYINPKGGFFKTDITKKSIASEATRMLKYKKHEWIIFAFEKNRKIELVWTNKGNKHSVHPLIRINQQLNLAKKKDFETIYIFHNHPPYKLFKDDKIRLIPSKQDLRAAKNTPKFYQEFNITIAEYICANKGYRPYYIHPKDNLFPFESIFKELDERANSRFRKIGLWFKIWFTKDLSYIIL